MMGIIKYIALTAAAWYFYRHFIKPFLSPLRKIPGCPYRPIIGNLLEAMKEGANNNGIRWMQKYNSRIIRFYYFGGEGAVLLGDPAIAKHILISNSKNYRRSSSRFLEVITPGFLALISGEEHHAMRRLVNPVFSSRTIEGFVPSFEYIGRKFLKIWLDKVGDGKDVPINAQHDLTRFTLDAICRCGFDYDMNSLENDQSSEVKAFKMILGGLELGFLQILNLSWFPTKKSQKVKAAIELYKSTITQVITSKQEKMNEGSNSKDILSQLLQARDEEGQLLSKNNLYSQVGGFLIAGYETTSMSLTWTLLELANHPDVQEKARQEVMSLMVDKDQTFTYKSLEILSYLTCVIKESLRHHTPFSTLFRRAVKDDYLQGYLIPAGTLIGVNLGALHRLPQIWPDPTSFKPERFQVDYDKHAFIPFGAGPYMCVGNIFSMTETKLILAMILRNFRIRLPEDYSYKVVRKLTIQPSQPLRLLVTPL